ncbi:MAG TPA: site-specific integrase [Anaerolineales bacterium]|nr:site-specific integrase [Anaerolineales bacterium]
MAETAPTSFIHRESTLDSAVKGWAMYLEDQGKSPHTIKAFTADIRLLEEFLPDGHKIGTVTTAQLNDFLEWLQDGRGVPCSPKTLARRITSVKALFRWLHGGGVLLVDPAEKVVQKSVISPIPVILTPAEVDSALTAADGFRQGNSPDHRHYTLLLLLLTTGLKKSEVLNLRTEHIDLEAPQGPTLFVQYPSAQHRYKERKIALTEDWIEAYRRYLPTVDSTSGVFAWSPRRLEYLLEDVSDTAGLDKHISFAMCRWTCALMDLRAGVEPNKIRQKLGISKIQFREISMKLEKLDRSTPK